MAAKVIWSPSSLSDVGSITEFIAADNVHAALRVGADLVKAIERLSEFPELGHALRDENKPHRRELVFAQYRIIYRLAAEENPVTVLRIWHGARGRPELPSS